MFNYEIHELDRSGKEVKVWYWNDYYSVIRCTQGLRLQSRPHYVIRKSDNKVIESHTIVFQEAK